VLLEEEIVSYFVIVIVKVESCEKMRWKREIYVLCMVNLISIFTFFLSKNGIIIYLRFFHIEGQIFIMCVWSILVISFFLLMLIKILNIRIKFDLVKSLS
jgi:hypothetical protein